MSKFLRRRKNFGGVTLDYGWWKISGKKLVNWKGDVDLYKPSENDEIVIKKDFRDLDWSYLLKPDRKTGWVDANGQFYGCNAGDINLVGYIFFDYEFGEDLDTYGLARIEKDVFGNYCADIGIMPTEAQINKLNELGVI